MSCVGIGSGRELNGNANGQKERFIQTSLPGGISRGGPQSRQLFHVDQQAGSIRCCPNRRWPSREGVMRRRRNGCRVSFALELTCMSWRDLYLSRVLVSLGTENEAVTFWTAFGTHPPAERERRVSHAPRRGAIGFPLTTTRYGAFRGLCPGLNLHGD